MSTFKADLNREQILCNYLDDVYKQKGLNTKRISDKNLQYRGVDLVLTHNNKEYRIDEKAQLHYINKDLPTFTFELSYLNKNLVLKQGWLFDMKKETDYYFLITAIMLKNNLSLLEKPSNIKSIKITSVNRNKLITYLQKIGLSADSLLEYDKKFRQNLSFGKNKLKELNDKTEGLIYFTKHLSEKPMNLQLKLQFLLDNGIAKTL